MIKKLGWMAFLITGALSLFALPAEPDPPTCVDIKLADIGWTDVSATTAVAAELLSGLGYEPKINILALPVTFAGMKNNDVDIFLGNWMPTQGPDIAPYLKDKSVEVISQNLSGAKYTLAVPQYAYDAGLRSFGDIHKFKKQLGGKIYGIEPGNDGNAKLLEMIESNAFGLKDFSLVESSEQGMLTAVKQNYAHDDWVVFLGWAPHPMNAQMNMAYLSGGDTYFGPNFGASTVHTVTRAGYKEECPMVAGLLQQLTFEVRAENEMMDMILTQKMSPKEAAIGWIKAHPEAWRTWVAGTTSLDGLPGNLAFKDYLKRQTIKPAWTFYRIPVGSWVEYFVTKQTATFASTLHLFSGQAEATIDALSQSLASVPFYIIIGMIALGLFWLKRSWALSLSSAAGLLLIVNFGLWQESIDTMVLVLLATGISVSIGVPLGIAAAKKQWVYMILRPLLDLMQTIPTFVYLIPTLMLFGLGVVPGLISTVVFAIAAPIRLTYLGFQSFPRELKEAAMGLGSRSWPTLLKVELPYLKPAIIAGISQCIMLSLSMVVIAAMVGADGLGTSVVRALNTVNIELGFEAGLAIVILAIVLDRAFSQKEQKAA